MQKKPLVSVVMPVYNGEAFLRESIQSILEQTYHNSELIIINDGSTDGSRHIIEQQGDSRIAIYDQANQGLATTLNRGINLANGKYVARQDQDDVSFPQRIEKQVEFLESHSDYGMVGTWAEIWMENSKTLRQHRHPSETACLKFELLFDNPFVHSSVMLRKAALEKVGMYSTDPSRQPPEDYELWSRVSRHYEVGNVPETLLVYRETSGSMSRDGPSPFLDRVINISVENLLLATGRTVGDVQISDLAALTKAAYYRVSPKPRLRQILSVLNEACDSVCASGYGYAQAVSVRERARMRSDDVRYHYWRHRHGHVLGTAFCRVANTVTRLIST